MIKLNSFIHEDDSLYFIEMCIMYTADNTADSNTADSIAATVMDIRMIDFMFIFCFISKIVNLRLQWRELCSYFHK